MTFRTKLPIIAVAVTGVALAGCVQPTTRAGRIDLAPPKVVVTALPNVQPAPALPQNKLPAPDVAIGRAQRQWLPGADLGSIAIRPMGPEADPYLQHYPPVIPAPAGVAVLEGLTWIEPLMPIGSDAGTNPVNPWVIEPKDNQPSPYWQQYLPSPVLPTTAWQSYLPVSERLWLPGTDLRAIRIAPFGPEADPTLQHQSPAKLTEKLWLPGVDLRLIDLTVPGPEADPYLQHVP